MTAPEAAQAGADVHEVVLDTNVWLDILVFGEPGVAPLRAALANGYLRAHVGAFGLAELERVLAYRLGRFNLDREAQARALSACRASAREFHAVADLEAPRTAVLPTCRDPADQPFLELARDCGARLLVTRDRDLLMLARKRNPPLPFVIATPRVAIALLGLPG